MPVPVTGEAEPLAGAETYAQVQQFYARHMHLLDAGAADEWARTFTEDGMFAPPSLPEPVRGRAALAAGLRESAARLARTGEVRRHCVMMIDVRPQSDGSLRVRSYTQVVATTPAEGSRLLLMCACHDVLVWQDGQLLVQERRVTRDDRP
ncbi:nuclear transport factor 2 family protein [Micromonospora sp. NPDC049559]|uniref:nuclear transport factor 2 family protein n=1 Tax=Micromonospora sp. NPDC049559 TaxID=3155923 RepID=UPI0034245F8A